ncbi:MAG: hypothetical protein DCC71_20035, partial [Proteobacteria bacterium]
MERAAAFCAPCERAIPRLPPGGCAICQALLGAPGERCGACARERWPLARVAAEAPFEGEVAQWVRRFKYPPPGFAGLDPGPGAALAALLHGAARRLDGEPPVLVVPVPIHPGRRRARGFHPAGELAQALARRIGARCDARA